MNKRDEYFEKRYAEIEKLYPNISKERIRDLGSLVYMYGGTEIAKLVLDIYDSLVYDETPKGPDGEFTL